MAELNLSDLNLAARSPENMIIEDERTYHDRISRIAEYISSHSEIKLVLLAGPSGSGKTTTANLIADGIRALGEEAMVVSLDDFYKDHDDPNYPKNELGGHDYERPEALDLDELKVALENISENRTFYLPKYDFKLGARVSRAEHPPIGHGCVIIEGLHALNPIISENLPKERVIKLFVSVSTNINSDGGRILSGRKIRFIRRLVRDSIYRGADAERTLSLWRGVLEAEDVYLYPYKYTADLAFDTFHRFELGAMRDRALRLLDAAGEDEYARIVSCALRQAEPIDTKKIPENSLIREFISGGIYDDIY